MMGTTRISGDHGQWMLDVTRDVDWAFTDAAGHEHRWAENFPTLRLVIDPPTVYTLVDERRTYHLSPEELAAIQVDMTPDAASAAIERLASGPEEFVWDWQIT